MDNKLNELEKEFLNKAIAMYEKEFAKQIKKDHAEGRNTALGEHFAKVIFHDVKLKLELNQ